MAPPCHVLLKIAHVECGMFCNLGMESHKITIGSLSNRTYDGDGDVKGIAKLRHNRKTIAGPKSRATLFTGCRSGR